MRLGAAATRTLARRSGQRRGLRVWPGLVEDERRRASSTTDARGASSTRATDDRPSRRIAAHARPADPGPARARRDRRPSRRRARRAAEATPVRSRWVSIRARDVTDETQRQPGRRARRAALEASIGAHAGRARLGRGDGAGGPAAAPRAGAAHPGDRRTVPHRRRCRTRPAATGARRCRCRAARWRWSSGDVAGADVPGRRSWPASGPCSLSGCSVGRSPVEALAALDRFAATVPGAAGTTGVRGRRRSAPRDGSPALRQCRSRRPDRRGRPGGATARPGLTSAPRARSARAWHDVRRDRADLPPGALLLLHSNGALRPTAPAPSSWSARRRRCSPPSTDPAASASPNARATTRWR